MKLSPFAILRPFEDRMDVRLLTREDSVKDDEGTQRVLGWETLATVDQVHGNRTILAEEGMSRDEEADGILTNEEGLGIGMRSADCQLLGVYDPQMHTCGILHVGWKGLLNDAIPVFLSTLSRAYKVAPSSLYVVAAPSLCTQCSEFTDPASELKGIDPKFFEGRQVNLRGIAEDQLFSMGVRQDRFERHPACPRCEPSTYWSYRADKQKVSEGYRNVLALRLK